MRKSDRTSEEVYDFLVAEARHSTGVVSLTAPEMARRTGKSPRTIDRALGNLKKSGRVVERKHRMTRIRLPDETNGGGLDFKGANFSGQDLRDSIMMGGDFYRADLRHADLRGANLRGAKLINADLRGARLEGAVLRGVEAFGANFSNATLSDVDAYGSNFQACDFTKAVVEDLRVGTPLQHQMPWENTIISVEQIAGVKGLANIHALASRQAYLALAGDPNAEIIASRCASKLYKCWPDIVCQIALSFPKSFIRWIRNWRSEDCQVDSLLHCWMELTIARTWHTLSAGTEEEFWSELNGMQGLPRAWSLYIQMQATKALGASKSVSDLLDDDRGEIDRLGGCFEVYWSTRAKKKFSGLPEFLTKDDCESLAETLARLPALSVIEVADKIFGSGEMIKGRNKRQTYSDAAG
jgi:hypothetical protein